MNGLSDVRLKLHGLELEGEQRPQLTNAPAGMGRWELMLHRWRTRRQLLELTPAQLKDIGLSAADAQQEGLKPFWKD